MTSTFDELLTELASSHVPVLLLGEAGVGKRLLARQIHDSGPWRDAPFLESKCRGTDENAIRSVFGVESNGSTKPFTVYFDGIESLSIPAQRALLTCLETREGKTPWPRVITSGASDLEMEVRTARFREDLYYKLSGICLPIPPLRYRKENIHILAEQFLEKYAGQFNRPKPELTPVLLRFLHSHPWMGNLHELEEAMRTVVAVGNIRVAIAALQSSTTTGVREKKNGLESLSLKEVARAASQRAEREAILKVLSRTHWNRKKAAEELRISYKALLYKLKEINSSPAGQGGRDQ